MQNVIFTSVKMLQQALIKENRRLFSTLSYVHHSSSSLSLSVCLCGGLSMTPQWSALPYWVCHGGWWLKSQRNLWDVCWSVMLDVQKCVCVLFCCCLHVYLCVRITRLYLQCVTFLQVHKALWNNVYQLKKRHAGWRSRLTCVQRGSICGCLGLFLCLRAD